jgi:hypothetical protein
MEKEYKPILVLYVENKLSELTMEARNEIKEKFGYEGLIIPVKENQRAEIISVDKATIVEDIQKYINLKIES